MTEMLWDKFFLQQLKEYEKWKLFVILVFASFDLVDVFETH